MSEISTLIDQWSPYIFNQELQEETGRPIAEHLLERYHEPWRHYHDLSHVKNVGEIILSQIATIEDKQAMGWALFGHDAIYLPQLYKLPENDINERQSANLTYSYIAPYVTPATAQRVVKHIWATAGHDGNTSDKDTQLFLDADLAILGADEADFEAYDRGVYREFVEFGNVAADVYTQKRVEVLGQFALREQLYYTDYGRDAFSARARQNIERKLLSLQSI